MPPPPSAAAGGRPTGGTPGETEAGRPPKNFPPPAGPRRTEPSRAEPSRAGPSPPPGAAAVGAAVAAVAYLPQAAGARRGMAGGRAGGGSGRRPGLRWPRALWRHEGNLRGRPAGPIVCAGRRGGGAASPRGRRGAWYGPGIHAKRLWRTAPRLPPLLASRKAGGPPPPRPGPAPTRRAPSAAPQPLGERRGGGGGGAPSPEPPTRRPGGLRKGSAGASPVKRRLKPRRRRARPAYDRPTDPKWPRCARGASCFGWLRPRGAPSPHGSVGESQPNTWLARVPKLPSSQTGSREVPRWAQRANRCHALRKETTKPRLKRHTPAQGRQKGFLRASVEKGRGALKSIAQASAGFI